MLGNDTTLQNLGAFSSTTLTSPCALGLSCGHVREISTNLWERCVARRRERATDRGAAKHASAFHYNLLRHRGRNLLARWAAAHDPSTGDDRDGFCAAAGCDCR